MANAMLDTRQEGDAYRRIEVITGQSRRRRWTAEEKSRIVAESFDEGANISEVARRNGVARGLLTSWRRQFAATADVRAVFVHGAEDDVVPISISRDCAQAMPRARLEVVDESGHLVVIDQKERLSQIVLDFVADSETS